MFILKPGRGLPSRHRVYDDTVESDASVYYEQPDWTYETKNVVGTVSEMYDSPGPRYAWKNVWHLKTEYMTQCYTGLIPSPCGEPTDVWCTNWANEPAQPTAYEDIIAHPEVQKAFAKVARRWHDKLYQIRPEQIPDMFVFIAEAHELSRIFSIILEYAKQMISLLRKVRKLKNVLKPYVRRKNPRSISKKDLSILKRDTSAAINKVSGDMLSLKFGVMQPIRDFTTLISAMYGYIDTFNFVPRTENIREIVKLHYERGQFYTGCGSYSCTPGHNQEAPVVEDVEVAVNCSVHFANLMKGTKMEKVVAAVLLQCGIMPSLDSFWELTHLSWLIDYFFATEKLIGRMERGSDHLGFVQALVYDSCISLKIMREYTCVNPCVRLGGLIGSSTKIKDTYYERITGDGHDLLSAVNWVRKPEGKPLQNAVAFLLQTLS